MKLCYHTKNYSTCINGRVLPKGAVYGALRLRPQDPKVIYYCDDFRIRDGRLTVHFTRADQGDAFWNGKWVTGQVRSGHFLGILILEKKEKFHLRVSWNHSRKQAKRAYSDRRPDGRVCFPVPNYQGIGRTFK